MIPFVDPTSGHPLTESPEGWRHPGSGAVVAPVVRGVPRFVRADDDYAENFGFQWNLWHSTLSDSRNPDVAQKKRDLLLARTHFDAFPLEGRTLLECGMGGGDDTEALLGFPFAEVHAFDLSRAVDRARAHLDDPRLVLSQASIFDIPYADRSFDFVFCHRVLQHTPDPELALRKVAAKVKVGGVLFVHSYNRSLFWLMNYKYKYRPLTKRLPHEALAAWLERWGPALDKVNRGLRLLPRVGSMLSHAWVPFEWVPPSAAATEEARLEIAKLCTFDALTPLHDHPMTWRTMRALVEGEGFEVRFFEAHPTRPLLCTAVRRR